MAIMKPKGGEWLEQVRNRELDNPPEGFRSLHPSEVQTLDKFLYSDIYSFTPNGARGGFGCWSHGVLAETQGNDRSLIGTVRFEDTGDWLPPQGPGATENVDPDWPKTWAVRIADHGDIPRLHDAGDVCEATEAVTNGFDLVALLSKLPHNNTKMGFSIVVNRLLKCFSALLLIAKDVPVRAADWTKCTKAKPARAASGSKPAREAEPAVDKPRELLDLVSAAFDKADDGQRVTIKNVVMQGLDDQRKVDEQHRKDGELVGTSLHNIIGLSHYICDHTSAPFLDAVKNPAGAKENRPSALDAGIKKIQRESALAAIQHFNSVAKDYCFDEEKMPADKIGDGAYDVLSKLDINKGHFSEDDAGVDRFLALLTTMINQKDILKSNYDKSGNHEGGKARWEELWENFSGTVTKNVAIFYCAVLLEGVDTMFSSKMLNLGDKQEGNTVSTSSPATTTSTTSSSSTSRKRSASDSQLADQYFGAAATSAAAQEAALRTKSSQLLLGILENKSYRFMAQDADDEDEVAEIEWSLKNKARASHDLPPLPKPPSKRAPINERNEG